ncbi:urea transporter [Sulfurimonas sp. SAG-AH-194-I05]|nr:urea transporter [Sulfurimonas sp. SAG-AH-194-I05]MDF1874500.1 urea transporter [Sulfurimonas sp. SAG-AH-194-I05]
MQRYNKFFINVLKPYSAILFLNSKFAGLFLLVLTFINPSVAISGIVAVGCSIFFANLIGMKETYLSQGFYLYNSLLVGMGIGFLFLPSPLSMILIAIASSLTFMLSFVLNRLFSNYKIPILSLPFSLVTMFVYLASLKYSSLLSSLVHNEMLFDIDLPLYISSFLTAVGTIFFLPNNIAGLLMLGLMVYFSRIIFFMALVGFYFGVYIHSVLLGSFTQALYDPYAFNYILVAIALCGIFLLPTLKNFILALMGVAISVLLTDAIGILFHYYSIPVFTLPFNITVIIFIFTLSVVYYEEFNMNIKSTPEESLSHYLSKYFRFGDINAKIALPFTGEWNVYQAFDDVWTHKGAYKYAYDFVKLKDSKTYKNDGELLEDYFAFGESVLSPVSGYVVDLRNDLVDNILGEVDTINNWGNFIIIKSDAGYFVEISHLMKNSLLVYKGDYIQVNTPIAKCGNSGYSPEPHIHIQVQNTGLLGAITQKFSFEQYMQKNHLHYNALPVKQTNVQSVLYDKNLSSRFIFILDDVFEYEVFENSEYKEDISFSVKMNSYGEFYLCDEANNKLYFYNDAKQFYFYTYEGKSSYLKQLFLLAPRIPFVSMQTFSFVDYLPVNLVKSKIQTLLTELLATINKEFYKEETRYSFDGKTLSSPFGSVRLDVAHKGHTEINYNNTQLRRKV